MENNSRRNALMHLAGMSAVAGAGALLASREAGAAAPVSPWVLTPQGFGAKGDGMTDDTNAIQSWIAAIEMNGAPNFGYEGYLPPGNYLVKQTLQFTKQNVTIRGAGMFQSQINSMVANGLPIFTVLSNSIYWRPIIQNIGIVGSAQSGYGFDLSALSEVYNFCFKDIYSITGGAAIYAPNIFSGYFQNWVASSYNDHVFKVVCGPAVAWISTYAQQVPAGKAGYRLCGQVSMYACNGINSGDYWGIFGQATSQNDGFQNDFPSLGDSYGDVWLSGCNIEAFNYIGILQHAPFRFFEIHGGSLDRSSLSNPYHSIIRCHYSPSYSSATASNPVKLNVSAVFPGPGLPTMSQQTVNGLPARTYLYSDAGNFFIDQTGAFVAAGITQFWGTPYGGMLPIVTELIRSDVYQDTAIAVSAISPRRLSIQMQRYVEPAQPLTPSGANATIDVTGYTKVIVSPAAQTTIAYATFSATPGVGNDYGRNGDLIIEAGNGNVTLVNNSGGSGRFVLATTAQSVAMYPGQVIRFAFSETLAAWIQV